MTAIELNYIKKHRRWKLSFDEYLRLSFLFFPLSIVGIGLMMIFFGVKNEVTELKLVGIIEALAGSLVTSFVARRLNQSLSFEHFDMAQLDINEIEKALTKLDFANIESRGKDFLQLRTKISWQSWGETITIILEDSGILINSAPTGSGIIYQAITFTKDKKNIKRVIEEIKNTATNKS